MSNTFSEHSVSGPEGGRVDVTAFVGPDRWGDRRGVQLTVSGPAGRVAYVAMPLQDARALLLNLLSDLDSYAAGQVSATGCDTARPDRDTCGNVEQGEYCPVARALSLAVDMANGRDVALRGRPALGPEWESAYRSADYAARAFYAHTSTCGRDRR